MGYIDSATLVEQSGRYIRLHAAGRPAEGDICVRNPLLPLCILEKIPEGVELTKCQGCRRELPVSCFMASRVQWGNSSNCWVCRAATLRNLGYA
jgi:hypothetical protein